VAGGSGRRQWQEAVATGGKQATEIVVESFCGSAAFRAESLWLSVRVSEPIAAAMPLRGEASINSSRRSESRRLSARNAAEPLQSHQSPADACLLLLLLLLPLPLPLLLLLVLRQLDSALPAC